MKIKTGIGKMLFIFCLLYSGIHAKEWVANNDGSTIAPTAGNGKTIVEVQAYDINNKPIELKNVEQIKTYRLHLLFPGFYKEKITLNEVDYDQISIDGLPNQGSEIGAPSLPYKFFMLPVIQNASYSYRITTIQSNKIKDLLVAPTQLPSTDTAGTLLKPFKYDHKIYSSDKDYPLDEIAQVQLVAMRDHQFLSLNLFPYKYNLLSAHPEYTICLI